jgi:tRNA(Arg) A34 adenosine deaminase TadA
MNDDLRFLSRAIEIAFASMRANRGGPFGAVVVKDGTIVGEGANSVLATNDPTAHAEIVAIRNAAAALGTFSLAGTTLYATSEPCPMCLAATYWARIGALVYANGRELAAGAGFDDAFFYDEMGRPPEERLIATRRVELADAAMLFDEWKKKPDKTPY